MPLVNEGDCVPEVTSNCISVCIQYGIMLPWNSTIYQFKPTSFFSHLFFYNFYDMPN